MTDDNTAAPTPAKARRGFAAMSAETQREIAQSGGRAAHAAGTAHEWTRATASVAGRKGGLASAKDREEMARRGRAGGKASGRSRRGEAPSDA